MSKSAPGANMVEARFLAISSNKALSETLRNLRDEGNDADKSDVTDPDTFGPVLRICCVIRSTPIDNVRVCFQLSGVINVLMIIHFRVD